MEGVLLVVAAVIVTHNSETHIGECVEALTRMAPTIRPIIVDNASRDQTLKTLPANSGVTVIANRENRGFAAAVNQGTEASEADLVLLLNPDAIILTSVDALVQAAREHGVAAGRLVGEKGEDQKGFGIRRFPAPSTLIFELLGLNRLWRNNPVNRQYRYLDRGTDVPGPVEQPAGAFLMFRADVWRQLGGFDEAFFPIWFEDVDFCRRAVSAGYRIQYVPTIVAKHSGGHSIQGLPLGCRALFWCDSLLKYAGKHFRSLAYRAVCLAVVLGSVPRMVAGMIVERSFTPGCEYLKILRMAVERMFSAPAAVTGKSGLIKI